MTNEDSLWLVRICKQRGSGEVRGSVKWKFTPSNGWAFCENKTSVSAIKYRLPRSPHFVLSRQSGAAVAFAVDAKL
jgi:hypothetical protein